MKRILIKNLKEAIGKEVLVKGWVHTVRNQKKMQFVVVRDHTGLVQIVHERKSEKDNIAAVIEKLTAESSVEVMGKVVENPQVKLGQIEIVVENFLIDNLSLPSSPITEETNLDGRMDWRFLDLRRPSNLLVFQVQTTAEHAMREFWQREGFIEIHSPKFMGSASESGAELFEVKYFDRKAYLAQSPQFYKQMGMAAGFDRVFEIGPVFRANPSFTSRHDTEFTSVDVEISWINSHEDVMRLEEEWLKYILEKVKEKHGDEIEKTFGAKISVPKTPFPRITMAQAYEILQEKMNYTVSREGKGDLDPEGERLLSKYVFEKFGHEFVFVTDYPISVRPFYHMRYEDRPDTTKSFDLIWKGLEVTTGAQREHRYDMLIKQVKEKGLKPESIQYYLDFFRYGCPPHGGYGFGLTRMLMIMLGFKNVREVTYLYRGPNRLSP